MTFMVCVLVRRRVRQQRDRARALDSVRQLALVARTTSGDPPRDDLAPLRHEPAQTAHVLVVDEINLVRAELADLAPAEAPALHRFLGRWNGYSLLLRWGPCNCAPPNRFFLERNVVVAAAGRFIREPLGGSRGRRCARPARAALQTADELNALGDDLRRRALLAILTFPIARLDPTFDEDLATLVEVFAAILCGLPPRDHG